jgi:hypothetical protein
MNMNEFVGKRCLLVVRNGSWDKGTTNEFKILEVSPSGNWTKLMNLFGNKFWSATETIALVEVLKEFEKYPNKTDVL